MPAAAPGQPMEMEDCRGATPRRRCAGRGRAAARHIPPVIYKRTACFTCALRQVGEVPTTALGQPVAMEDGGEGSSAEERAAALAEAVQQRLERLAALAAELEGPPS